MVGCPVNAPVVTSDKLFVTPVLQTGCRNTSREIGSGGGSCTHGGRAYEARLNLILPAVKWWSRRVTLPHQLACRASALLVCHRGVECRICFSDSTLRTSAFGFLSGFDIRSSDFKMAGCLGAAP